MWLWQKWCIVPASNTAAYWVRAIVRTVCDSSINLLSIGARTGATSFPTQARLNNAQKYSLFSRGKKGEHSITTTAYIYRRRREGRFSVTSLGGGIPFPFISSPLHSEDKQRFGKQALKERGRKRAALLLPIWPSPFLGRGPGCNLLFAQDRGEGRERNGEKWYKSPPFLPPFSPLEETPTSFSPSFKEEGEGGREEEATTEKSRHLRDKPIKKNNLFGRKGAFVYVQNRRYVESTEDLCFRSISPFSSACYSPRLQVSTSSTNHRHVYVRSIPKDARSRRRRPHKKVVATVDRSDGSRGGGDWKKALPHPPLNSSQCSTG